MERRRIHSGASPCMPSPWNSSILSRKNPFVSKPRSLRDLSDGRDSRTVDRNLARGPCPIPAMQDGLRSVGHDAQPARRGRTPPRGCFVVVSGVSGSGKSSLAFDTLYAEGQRRYVESLSSYARQFIGQMKKADCDGIEGSLRPSPSIKSRVRTTLAPPWPRSRDSGLPSPALGPRGQAPLPRMWARSGAAHRSGDRRRRPLAVGGSRCGGVEPCCSCPKRHPRGPLPPTR